MTTITEIKTFASIPSTPKIVCERPSLIRSGTPRISIAPVRILEPTNDINSFTIVLTSIFLDSKTQILFVTKANSTAQTQESVLDISTGIPNALTNRE